MILYHGTSTTDARNIIENGISVFVGKKRVDFGQGFYMTPDKQTAVRWAIRKSEFEKPALIGINYDLEAAKRDLKVLTFESPSIEWAQFVINNRAGIFYVQNLQDTVYKKYNDHNIDVCIGQIADGDVFNLSRQISREGRAVTENDVLNITGKAYPGQISIHTENACKYVASVLSLTIR